MAELGYKFSHDWFSHNIPNWKKWLRKYKGKSNLSFLELGCYEGMATRWLLDNILTGPRSVITVVDTFKGSIEHKRMDNCRIKKNFMFNAGFDKRVKTYTTTTKQFFKATREKFDFVYVDASHKAKDVMSDALNSWETLKRSGILIFDDYGWKKYHKTSNLHPKTAIDAFLKMYEGEYKLIAMDYQVCIMKTVK